MTTYESFRDYDWAYDASRMEYVNRRTGERVGVSEMASRTSSYTVPSGYPPLTPGSIIRKESPYVGDIYNPTTLYGKTPEEWLAIEKERNELKKFIEDKLDEVIKGMNDES